MKTIVSFFIVFITAVASQATTVRGMNLTEIGGMVYDANNSGGAKTPAQVAVDELKAIGVNHIVLNPRAVMTNPKANEVIPKTPANERAQERARYQKLISYIQSQGMTVGIRPIFFVVDANGNTPYLEQQSNGTSKVWWHGNIQPVDPNLWFDSFKRYLDIYLLIAKLAKADEFTIGAELYSMTVGIEDQWKEYPHGFPKQWNDLLSYVRAKLPAGTRVMYDINFTDDNVKTGGLSVTGGELERWRYRLVDLAPPTDPAKRLIWENDPNQGPIWKELSTFWKNLDAVGIDMYRSLASAQDKLPTNYSDLVSKLQIKTDEYASQLDTILAEIEATLVHQKPIIFKEIGYRSTTNGFIDPFNYSNKIDDVNIVHQAAAFQAFFNSFWQPGWVWFSGVAFWDVSVDPSRKGVTDSGFSPLGKKQTSKIIETYFKAP